MSTAAPTHPLPAPIGIPAGRRARSCSTNRPPLSSSPTRTPFSITPLGSTPLGGTPRANTPNGAYSPPNMSVITSAPAPSAIAAGILLGGTSPPRSPTLSTSPPSPKVTTPPSAHRAAALPAVSASPTSPAKDKDGKDGTKKKHKPWERIGALFNMDDMLGALDPNRVALSSCPEPTKTVVFGAETETGLAVCRALLKARHYQITALMVDYTTPATAELREQGVKVVQVDMDSPVSYARYLAGSKAVYLSSNVLALHAILQHQPEPKRTEIARAADRCQLGKAVRACSRAKAGHVIFRVNACGHEVVENMLGKHRVVMEAPEDLDKLGVEHTILHTTVPYTRICEWLKDGPDGLILDVPIPDDIAMPMFAVEQTGDYVLAALRNPKRWAGQEMHAIAAVMTPSEIAARLSKLARRPVDTMHPTREEFNSFETHERLACRWDAWAQLVNNEYQPDYLVKAGKHDVPDEWSFNAWLAQDKEIHQRLKF